MPVALKNGSTLEDVQNAFPDWVKGRINRLPTNKMFGVSVTCTPELAKTILDKHNIAETGQPWRNRKMHKHILDKYKKDMENGNWLLSHQGIAFSEDGKLIDGQHRLESICRSKVPQEIFVVFNVKNSDEVMHVLDSGCNRTMSDRYFIEGEDIAQEIFSIARSSYRSADSSYRPCSVTDQRNFINQFLPQLRLTADCLRRDKKDSTMKGICNAPCQAAFFRAFVCNPDREKELLVLANAFRSNDTADVPHKWRAAIKYLRQRVRDVQGYGSESNKKKYFLIEHWLKGYLEDVRYDDNHSLHLPKNKVELFPLPDYGF